MASPIPVDEASRLRTLRALNILDTPREHRFDRFALMAAQLFDVPIAFVSFIDADRQWFKAAVGLTARQLPRSVSPCAATITQAEPLVVADTAGHSLFQGHPYVSGPMGIRFYAGRAIRTEDGSAVGTVAIMDRRPRAFGEDEIRLLNDLADLVAQEVCALGNATLDRVTGLPSRFGFESVADQVLAISSRHNQPVSLLLLELLALEDGQAGDGEEGDERLVETAELLQYAFRQSDVIAHLGNGRFGVLLTGADVAQASLCLERLREELRARNAVAGTRHRITYRLGVAEYSDTEHRSVNDLILEAASNADRPEEAGQYALA